MRELKELQVLCEKYKGKISALDKQINLLVEEKKIQQKGLSDAQSEINLLLRDVVVTEHAMLRYFERICGYDLEEIKRKILPDNIVESIKLLGNCRFPVNGHTVVVKDNSVVTIVKTEGK